jgi:hypothetical protein
MLEELDKTDWESFPQPPENPGNEVPLALRHVLVADEEGAAGEAYHRLLDSFGNDHAGTYFPVVLPAVRFLGEILASGSSTARRIVLDALIDLVHSFEPAPGFQTVLGADGTVQSLAKVLHDAVSALQPVLSTIEADAANDQRLRALAKKLGEVLSKRTS